MKRYTFLSALLFVACSKNGGAPPSSPPPPAPPVVASAAPSAAPAAVASAQPETPAQHAEELAHRYIIVDGHIDVPYRLADGRDKDGKLTEDVTGPTQKGNFDYPRAVKGGLDAPFFSIYVPARYMGHGAKKFADSLIDIVQGIVKEAPDHFALAGTPDEVRKNFAEHKITLLMGMENGSPIEDKLENVQHFYDRGVRYITLAHSKDNHIADSSYDTHNTNNGLSKFGVKVVHEMNRVGILVDVSHISDKAFWGVMKASQVPVIASHSSCRHFTPGFERNMSDEMIKALAAHGGVIMVNFGSGFVDAKIQKEDEAEFKQMQALLAKKGLSFGDKGAKKIRKAFEKAHPHEHASVEEVADNIEHVIQLVGVDHVGLGSDFDGLGDTLPRGLEDVSKYPNLIRLLIERGHSDDEIRKICSGNLLRVWQKTVDYAARQAGGTNKPAR